MIYAVLVVAVGAVLFHWLEGWTRIDSFYFVVITLTTIGYGDLTPTTSATKLVTIFYGLNAIMLLLMIFDVIRQVRGWHLPPRSAEEQDPPTSRQLRQTSGGRLARGTGSGEGERVPSGPRQLPSSLSRQKAHLHSQHLGVVPSRTPANSTARGAREVDRLPRSTRDGGKTLHIHQIARTSPRHCILGHDPSPSHAARHGSSLAWCDVPRPSS
jgi:hypothetical protein